MQLGGNDQVGNMRAGKDLVHKIRNEATIYGLTVPLITSKSGGKLGKTSSGKNVWIDKSMTTHLDFYQYFVRTTDKDVERLLKLFTFLPLSEIAAAVEKHFKAPEKLHAQKLLAAEVTRLVRGEEALIFAKKATAALYSGDQTALSAMTSEEIKSTFEGAAYVRLLFSAGLTVLDAAVKIGCFTSEIDAERVIRAGGFYVNHERMTNPDEVLIPDTHLLPNDSMLVRVGKKNYYVVEWTL